MPCSWRGQRGDNGIYFLSAVQVPPVNSPEIPAGIVEPGEKAAETAARELQEEIGYIPGS